MTNPFKRDDEISEEDAERIVRIDNAFCELTNKLAEDCKNPSRYFSIALTLLEQAHAMAVKSVSNKVIA